MYEFTRLMVRLDEIVTKYPRVGNWGTNEV